MLLLSSSRVKVDVFGGSRRSRYTPWWTAEHGSVRNEAVITILMGVSGTFRGIRSITKLFLIPPRAGLSLAHVSI